MYSEAELQKIRTAIALPAISTREQAIAVRQALGEEKPHPGTFSMLSLALNDFALYHRLNVDPRVHDFAYSGFFPETYPLVYGSETSPQLEFGEGNRGSTVMLLHPTKNVVIKPVQSSREASIAQIAGELGVGPTQYTTIDGFICEEYIDGELLTKKMRNTSGVEAKSIGNRIGEIFDALHNRSIYYNDTNIADDMGRSHIMVPHEGPARLFDFGVALNLEKYPYFNDAEVLDFARTLPVMNMMWHMDSSSNNARKIIAQYRPIISQMSKQQILDRDINFINEGLSVINNANALAQGFQETYSSNR